MRFRSIFFRQRYFFFVSNIYLYDAVANLTFNGYFLEPDHLPMTLHIVNILNASSFFLIILHA